VWWLAVERLKRDFFARDPGTIIEIWMFSRRPELPREHQCAFLHRPSSGSATSIDVGRGGRHVSLGAGTLVHEMVHAFMAANFPAAPIWFNEGLASLFEQPTEVNGHIEARSTGGSDDYSVPSTTAPAPGSLP